MTENYIELLRITKKFKNSCIIDDISVEFEKGKIHGITGENGSGKTVLLKIICGLMRPDSGSVVVGGKKIGIDTDFPESCGIIIENPGFLPYVSGYKNLKYLADIRRKIGKNEIEKAMSLLGLDPKSRKGVGKYSLGMKQRLGVAQAIMEDPSLLILDEPMNALDKDGVETVRGIITEQKNRGKTILLVSHNATDIEMLCDDIFEFSTGKLIERV